MPNVPPLPARVIISVLKNLGFEEVRQRGSHKQFRHADGRGTTAPVHPGRDVSPTLVRKIARDIDLFACDSEWVVRGDLYYFDLDEAKIDAARYYGRQDIEWQPPRS